MEGSPCLTAAGVGRAPLFPTPGRCPEDELAECGLQKEAPTLEQAEAGPCVGPERPVTCEVGAWQRWVRPDRSPFTADRRGQLG